MQDLPPPHDDGAAAHLPGTELPEVELPTTSGGRVALDELIPRTVIFVLPSIGGIDDSLLDEWTAIPGARGCTPEACGVRDRFVDFRSVGSDVLGVSSQAPEEQRRVVERLQLPYPLLSDEHLALAGSLGLPTFEFRGRRYLKRLTLIVSRGRMDAALYPVFPPDAAAEQALTWLRQ
jgi:peroxiredoxin